MENSKILFPYEEVRDIQEDLINDIHKCVKEKSHAILHAPTGLGKTIAALAPTLKYAIDNNLTIFFLTSRHTQHRIAIDTLQLIKEKFDDKIITIDIIGKRHMCLQPGMQILSSFEFSEYCKKLKEDKKCDFFMNVKNNNALTKDAKSLIDDLKQKLPLHVEDMMIECDKCKTCPYEITIEIGKKANVIICDYYYIFSPTISKNLLL